MGSSLIELALPIIVDVDCFNQWRRIQVAKCIQSVLISMKDTDIKGKEPKKESQTTREKEINVEVAAGFRKRRNRQKARCMV